MHKYRIRYLHAPLSNNEDFAAAPFSDYFEVQDLLGFIDYCRKARAEGLFSSPTHWIAPNAILAIEDISGKRR